MSYETFEELRRVLRNYIASIYPMSRIELVLIRGKEEYLLTEATFDKWLYRLRPRHLLVYINMRPQDEDLRVYQRRSMRPQWPPRMV